MNFLYSAGETPAVVHFWTPAREDGKERPAPITPNPMLAAVVSRTARLQFAKDYCL